MSRSLLDRLTASDVALEVPDGNSLLLRGVPANPRFFNKPRTNLLLARVDSDTPFFTCVDEDIEYLGANPALIRAFATAHRRDGWKMLFAGGQASHELEIALEGALGLLGFDGGDPAWGPVSAESGLLTTCADDLSLAVDTDRAEVTIARNEEIDQVVACMVQWRPLLGLVVSPSGVGKTNLLHGIARRLRQSRPELRLLRIDLPACLAGTVSEAEREKTLLALVEEATGTPNTALALEGLAAPLAALPHVAALMQRALEQGVSMVATSLPEQIAELGAILGSRRRIVKLREPAPAETQVMVAAWREAIAAHHRVRIDEAVVEAAVQQALPLAGHLPGKAITLLDTAASMTRLGGESGVTLFHVYGAALLFPQVGAESGTDPRFGRRIPGR